MLSFFSFFRQGFIRGPALAGGEQEWVNRFPWLLAPWEGSCFFLHGVRVGGCIQGLGWRGGSGDLPTPLPVLCAGGMLSFWQGCLLLKKAQLCTCPTPCPNIGKAGSDMMIPQKAGCKGFHLAVAPFSLLQPQPAPRLLLAAHAYTK